MKKSEALNVLLQKSLERDDEYPYYAVLSAIGEAYNDVQYPNAIAQLILVASAGDNCENLLAEAGYTEKSIGVTPKDLLDPYAIIRSDTQMWMAPAYTSYLCELDIDPSTYNNAYLTIYRRPV